MRLLYNEWSWRGWILVVSLYTGWPVVVRAIVQVIKMLWSSKEGRPKQPYMAPRPLDSFVGREGEIERLEERLEPGSRAAITGVVGMGGIGKTELAKIVAERVRGRYGDGVLWADCQEQEVATIADLWAAQYGVLQLPGDDFTSKAASWRSLVNDRETLLIFDNVQPGQEIEPLFPSTGQSSVLITTREAHHPALRGIEPVRVDQFSPTEAMALAELVLGAGVARGQAEAAQHFFELVAYLPLAVSIGLYTATELGWTLIELVRRLEQAGAIKALDGQARRRSVGATFETAWANLDEELQKAFGTLAVFNQGPSFDTIAMAAVLDVDKVVARGFLNRLAGRSLLTAVGERRWSLHRLLREFVEGKLAVEDLAWGRMAVFFVNIARLAEKSYLKGGQNMVDGLRIFDLERLHIKSGQAWAAEHADEALMPLELCDAYATVAQNCVDMRLSPEEKIQWLRAAIKATRKLGDRQGEGLHLANLGISLADLGQIREGIESLEQALAISRQLGDRPNEGTWLSGLGHMYCRLGDPYKAVSCHEQGLMISKEVNDRRGECGHLDGLGMAYSVIGEKARAAGYFQQALEIALEMDDMRMAGTLLGNVGTMMTSIGECEKAVECYKQALKIAQTLGDQRSERVVLHNLGDLSASIGNVEKAADYYRQALIVAREAGDQRLETACLISLGRICSDVGNINEAIDYYGKALDVSRQLGDRSMESRCMGHLGSAYGRLQEVGKAIEFFSEASAISHASGDSREEEIILTSLGATYLFADQPKHAMEFYTRALSVAREIPEQTHEAHLLTSLGLTHMALGRPDMGKKFCLEALELAQEIGAQEEMGYALMNAGRITSYMGDMAGARKLLEKALAIYEAIENPNAKQVRGWLEALV